MAFQLTIILLQDGAGRCRSLSIRGTFSAASQRFDDWQLKDGILAAGEGIELSHVIRSEYRFGPRELQMTYLLIGAAALLSFANGANDNFKGVATLWGAGRSSYRGALAWATGFTLLGSLTAIWVAAGLVAKFNGSKLVDATVYLQLPFLVAVALGAAGTVLLASRLGLPVSTTHALIGALAGAGVIAAGVTQVQFGALGSGVVLPLLFSPVVALLLTVAVYPLVIRAGRLAGNRDCLCVDQPFAVEVTPANAALSADAALSAVPALRWAAASECATGAEAVRFSIGDGVHWFSGAAISFARGLNDTPKIAALLLVAAAGAVQLNYVLVAVGMAVGGALGALRVAETMSRRITPMKSLEAISANLVAAGLVTAASYFALPVSTTHVTSGGIFGIGMMHRGQADWRRVREILLSWVVTFPLGAALAAWSYWLLAP